MRTTNITFLFYVSCLLTLSVSCLHAQSEVEYNNKVYLRYDDGVHGQELFVRDTPDSEPELFKDIYPGEMSSFPTHFIVAFGKLLFSARTQAEGTELWISDGTAEGTTLFADLIPSGSSNPRNFVAFNSSHSVAFQANVPGRRICVANTEGATCTDLDIGSASPEGAPFQDLFIAAGRSDYAVGEELWSIDGNGNTTLIKDIRPGAAKSSSPRNFSEVQEPTAGLIFSAVSDEGTGSWFYDGSTVTSQP